MVALAIIVLSNAIFFCWPQYLAQQVDLKRGLIAKRSSIIPGTEQKFLHWQDFRTQTYGDILGLPGIIYGFYSLLSTSTRSNLLLWLLLMFLLVIACVVWFANMCLTKDHKPDWGFPEIGKISLGGLVHLAYFGVICSMAIICLIAILLGILHGYSFLITFLGGGIWIISFIFDYYQGHFEPLKKK